MSLGRLVGKACEGVPGLWSGTLTQWGQAGMRHLSANGGAPGGSEEKACPNCPRLLCHCLFRTFLSFPALEALLSGQEEDPINKFTLKC